MTLAVLSVEFNAFDAVRAYRIIEWKEDIILTCVLACEAADEVTIFLICLDMHCEASSEISVEHIK